jgi:acyl-CoA dehydrogenase
MAAICVKLPIGMGAQQTEGGIRVRHAGYGQGEGLNWWEMDRNLQRTVARYCPADALAEARPLLSAFGALCGREISPRADYTDRQEGRPRLRPYDREGQEISQVVYNPGYRQTLRDVYGSGIIAWRHQQPAGAPGPVPPTVTYAMGYMLSMAETGVYCPVVLTAATALIVDRFAPPALRARYLPGLTATDPDQLTQGATWLTEKTGGSDVGAITTVARREGEAWRLTGEKWFASNADAPVALALARPEGAPPGTAGLALFLVPQTLPDGSRNRCRIRRLKEKLGVIAVPSGEVLLEGAEAYLIAEAGRGFKVMMEAINLSRVMNAIGSAGLARRAFVEAAIYAARRTTFGKPLNQHPLMRAKLLHMLVDLEAITALAFRAADCFERGEPLHRLLVPIAKARSADRAVAMARQGIECFGGNGYIEEYVMPRLLRDAQVLTVWEGPENILALDCLRVLLKQGPADFLAEVQGRLGAVTEPELVPLRSTVGSAADTFRSALSHMAAAEPAVAEVQAVRLLNLMADILSATYLLEAAREHPHQVDVAAMFIERLSPRTGWGITVADRIALERFEAIMDGAC